MAKQGSTPKVITKKHRARLERERRQTRLIIGIAIAGILIVVGLISYGYLKENVFLLNEPVAEVNGEKITTGAWQERVKLQRVQLVNVYNQYAFYQQSFGFDYSQQMQQVASMMQSPDTIGQQVLDQMINEALIRQEAEKRGITVSDAEVEKSIQENFNFFPNGTPSPTVTPTEFSYPTFTSQQLTLYPSTATPGPTSIPEATATPENSVTPTATATTAPPTPSPVPQPPTATATAFTLEGFQTQYKDMLKNYETYNISETAIREGYRAELLRKKLLEEVTKDTPRTEEQVLARHILVETEEEAQTVYQKLTTGKEDFAKVARESSKDTGSGANGGDLGWFGRGAMVAEFEDAAFSQPIGEIGKPVKSQFGYHIIQVLARQELPLTDSQYQQKKETAFNDWLTARHDEAAIITHDIWMQRVPTEPTLAVQ
jgi:parvulin-like peptidyl-prolyl isomerase